MRTVRAFASESVECERFYTEIESNGLLHKKLGYGIGLFQVCIYHYNMHNCIILVFTVHCLYIFKNVLNLLCIHLPVVG
jgi:hypothetical protein